MKILNLKSFWTKLKTLAPRKVITYSLILTLLVAGFFVTKNSIFRADVSGAPVMTASSFYTWPTDSSFTTFAVLDGVQTDGKTISLAQDSVAAASASAKSVILRPTSDAFNPDKNAVPSTGANLFTMVKEVTPDDNVTYISPSGTFANVMFGHGAHGIPADMTVTGVKVYAKVSGVSTIPSTNLLGIYSNNQVYFGDAIESDQSVSGDWTVLSQNFPVCPFKVNKPWTFADLDAMAFGGVFGNSVKGAKMTQIYAEVSYDLVKYKMTGTATLENFTFEGGEVHIKNAVVDKTENGGTVKIEYSSDNFAWQEDPKDLRSVAQLFIRVTLTTPTNTKTPVLNKISLEFVWLYPPETPTPESPDGDVLSLKPELKASVFIQDDGATFVSSEWEIATSPTLTKTGKFKSPVPGITSTRDASISYTPNMSLTPDKKYFWHVRYKDSYGFASDWSDAWSFTVKLLEKPVNISPKDQSVGLDVPESLTPTLTALFVGATGTNWRIVLARDALAQPKIYVGTSANSFKITDSLDPEEVYGWSVQYWIGTPSNVSYWSDVTFFKTTIKRTSILPFPYNVSPVDESKSISLTPTLKVDFDGAIPDSVTWRFEGLDGQHNETIVGGSSNIFVVPASKILSQNTRYAWFVQYQIGANKSDWSEPTYFKTIGGAEITALSATNITSNSATLNGNIVTNKIALTTKGFQYSLTKTLALCFEPDCNTIRDEVNVVDGLYSFNISNLNPNTTYYFMATVSHNFDLFKSDWLSFKTLPYKVETLPTVTTATRIIIAANSAVAYGNITAVGAALVTKRGFEVTKIKDTVQANYGTAGSFEVGEFKANINLAVPNSTYYVRAYATNSAGTGYGAWIEFKSSSSISAPQVATSSVTSIGTNLASFYGNITSIGGAPVTKRGFQVTRDKTKVQADYPATGNFGVGEFTKTNVSLYFSNSTYYVRAYATNSIGTTNGAWVEFKTLIK